MQSEVELYRELSQAKNELKSSIDRLEREQQATRLALRRVGSENSDAREQKNALERQLQENIQQIAELTPVFNTKVEELKRFDEQTEIELQNVARERIATILSGEANLNREANEVVTASKVLKALTAYFISCKEVLIQMGVKPVELAVFVNKINKLIASCQTNIENGMLRRTRKEERWNNSVKEIEQNFERNIEDLLVHLKDKQYIIGFKEIDRAIIQNLLNMFKNAVLDRQIGDDYKNAREQFSTFYNHLMRPSRTSNRMPNPTHPMSSQNGVVNQENQPLVQHLEQSSASMLSLQPSDNVLAVSSVRPFESKEYNLREGLAGSLSQIQQIYQSLLNGNTIEFIESKESDDAQLSLMQDILRAGDGLINALSMPSGSEATEAAAIAVPDQVVGTETAMVIPNLRVVRPTFLRSRMVQPGPLPMIPREPAPVVPRDLPEATPVSLGGSDVSDESANGQPGTATIVLEEGPADVVILEQRGPEQARERRVSASESPEPVEAEQEPVQVEAEQEPVPVEPEQVPVMPEQMPVEVEPVPVLVMPEAVVVPEAEDQGQVLEIPAQEPVQVAQTIATPQTITTAPVAPVVIHPEPQAQDQGQDQGQDQDYAQDQVQPQSPTVNPQEVSASAAAGTQVGAPNALNTPRTPSNASRSSDENSVNSRRSVNSRGSVNSGRSMNSRRTVQSGSSVNSGASVNSGGSAPATPAARPATPSAAVVTPAATPTPIVVPTPTAAATPIPNPTPARAPVAAGAAPTTPTPIVVPTPTAAATPMPNPSPARAPVAAGAAPATPTPRATPIPAPIQNTTPSPRVTPVTPAFAAGMRTALAMPPASPIVTIIPAATPRISARPAAAAAVTPSPYGQRMIGRRPVAPAVPARPAPAPAARIVPSPIHAPVPARVAAPAPRAVAAPAPAVPVPMPAPAAPARVAAPAPARAAVPAPAPVPARALAPARAAVPPRPPVAAPVAAAQKKLTARDIIEARRRRGMGR